jgi:two-component system, OmpR family, KDP operon response regulator KdpE
MSKTGARILVVDDEIEIQRALRRGLAANGYQVFTTGSGEEALEAIAEIRPDLMLLDLGLPGISGLEVCKKVREVSNLPILVISVKDNERDKVRALDLGANDYVAKPFSMLEVQARVRVALRHVAQRQLGTEPRFQAGPLMVDFASRQVQLNGNEVILTPTEYTLLKIFITHRGKIMTRQMLLTGLWGAQAADKDHSLHVYVGQLRRKIEPIPQHPRFIVTIPGVGYRFNDDETTAEPILS